MATMVRVVSGMGSRGEGARRATLIGLLVAIALFFALAPAPSFAVTKVPDGRYSYDEGDDGIVLANGSGEGVVWNYPQTPGAELPEAGGTVRLDDEGYVIVPDESSDRGAAFLKKSAEEVPGSQGLFGMKLDIKGNQIENPVDVVLVIDFSSTMSGTKLENALAGVRDFLGAVADPLEAGRIRVAAVAYNREAYAMDGFATDPDEVLGFLENTAKSGSGTFVQKGLYEAQRLFQSQGRADARHLLIHVGDGSANCAYLPTDGATAYPNDGRIVAMGGYFADSYITSFQTGSERYYASLTTSDPNAVPTDDRQMLSNFTLGTAIDLKDGGIEIFSIGVDPSTRGKYTAYNMASDGETRYVAIDADLAGLSQALAGVASRIGKTVSGGTVADPMGEGVILQQGAPGFGPNDYELAGYRKRPDGTWAEDPQIASSVEVGFEDGVIWMSGLSLGSDERIVLEYRVRLDTEARGFRPDVWHPANGATTLDRLGDGKTAFFPVPSVKAPSIVLDVAKKWDDTVNVGGANGAEVDYSDRRPSSVGYTVVREPITAADAWTRSEPLELARATGWRASVGAVVPQGDDLSVRLPAYNNEGESFSYSVSEVGVPLDYESSVTEAATAITITNRLKVASFSLTKADEQGLPLAGAAFALYDEAGAMLCEAVSSNPEGTLTFSDLPAGRYKIRETKAPDGYVLSNVELVLTIAADDEGTLRASVETSDGSAWSGALRNVPVATGGGAGAGGAAGAGTGTPTPGSPAALASTGDGATGSWLSAAALAALATLAIARRCTRAEGSRR